MLRAAADLWVPHGKQNCLEAGGEDTSLNLMGGHRPNSSINTSRSGSGAPDGMPIVNNFGSVGQVASTSGGTAHAGMASSGFNALAPLHMEVQTLHVISPAFVARLRDNSELRVLWPRWARGILGIKKTSSALALNSPKGDPLAKPFQPREAPAR